MNDCIIPGTDALSSNAFPHANSNVTIKYLSIRKEKIGCDDDAYE